MLTDSIDLVYAENRYSDDDILYIESKTAFLISPTFNQRIYHLKHNLFEYMSCPVCDNPIMKYYKKNKYSGTCGDKSCITSLRKQTNLEKYGAEFASQTNLIKDKVKQTNLAKYGKHPSKLDSFSNKVKRTTQNKYGVEHYSQTLECKSKKANTNLEKYGVESPAQNKDIQDKIQKTNLKKYGVTCTLHSEKTKQQNILLYNAEYNTNNKKREKTNLKKYGVKYPMLGHWDKIISTNLVRYGVEYPFQSDNIQRKCNLTKTNFTDDRLHDKEFLIQHHHKNMLTLNEISDIIGVDQSTVSRHMKLHNIELKRFSVSSQERRLFDELSKYDIHIIQNSREIIPPLELDLYFPDHNLAIEINGLYWHSEDYKDNMYHENKRLLCEEKGITLLQFWDYEIDNNFDLIVSMIKNHCKLNTDKRIYARKCKIINISHNKEFITSFLDKNHIQGSTSITVCFGLEYENKIVSVMGFNKSNLKQYDYNLVRFCSLKDTSIVGGASRLLKQMSKFKLVSYSDARYSTGGLYNILGFDCIKINKPDYKYTLRFKKLRHKFGFRRKAIKSKYPKFYSEDLTEKEMMYNIGFRRVYGCVIKTWRLNESE